MTITNQISIILISVFCFACSAQKIKINNNCSKSNIESETEYFGTNLLITENVKDFNSNFDKSLDIIRISTSTGYEQKENFKRVYINENGLFVVDEKGVRKSKLDYEKILSEFQNCRELKTLINCSPKNSQSSIFRFFVKKGNNVVMTFTSNDLIENIDPNLINEELKYIMIFDNLK